MRRGRVWGAWFVFAALAMPSLLRVDLLGRVDRIPPRAHSLPASFGSDPLHYLSTAPADSLQLLPGIGPVLAARVVGARSGKRPFTSWDDLRLRVSGIGEKTVGRLKRAAEDPGL